MSGRSEEQAEACGTGGRNFYELPAGAGKRDPPSDPFWGGHCKKKKVIAELSSLSLLKKRLS